MTTMIMKDRRRPMRRFQLQSVDDTFPRKHLPPFRFTVKPMLVFGVLITMLLHLFPAYSISVAEAQQNQITQSREAKDKQKNEDRGLAQLSIKNNELSLNKLVMAKEFRRLSKLQDLSELFEKFSQTRIRLEENLKTLEINPEGERRQFVNLQDELQNTTLKVKQISRKVTTIISTFDNWIDYWTAEKDDVQAWKEGLGSSIDLPSVKHQLDLLQLVIKEAQLDLNSYLQPVLKVQENVGELQIALYRLNLKTDTLSEGKFQLGQGTTLFLSPAFFKQFDANLWKNTLENGATALRPNLVYLQPYKTHVVIVIALYLALISEIRRVRPITNKSSNRRFLVQRPYSCAGFLSLMALEFLCSDAGIFWLSLLRASALICLWRLSTLYIKDNRWTIIVRTFIGVFLFYGIVLVMEVPNTLNRLLVVVGSFVLIAITIYANRFGRLEDKSGILMTWLSRSLVATLVVVIVAEFMGKSDLSNFIFSVHFQTILALLTVRALFVCISGLLEIFLHASRMAYFRNNATQIFTMFHPFLVVTTAVTLVVQVLVSWDVYPSGNVALEDLSSIGFMMGTIKFSIGLGFGSLLFFYLAYCFSKLLEITLLDSILPRQNIHRGVQLSIARLSTYTILLLGFLGALFILGFNMTNLTIFGGAVGIGIGFGLQEIFTNFASGLILLFERPIKVGDVIMVDTEYGEVKKLGLRATIVETFDNSEIVVPNSALVTSNVTNWTLGRRQVRVKVPIGVAYGSDIDQVLEIITSCALEHPRVLSTPKPATLFIAHGASSLDFELRAFVPDIDDRMSTLSELNRDINIALDEAGIAIPFPQNDLHLKTVSPEVQAVMSDRQVQEGNR